jgi:hypothetical protein
MTTSGNKSLNSSILTEEGKLRHENSFLKERVSNLEVFKKNFFMLQNDLIEARERLSVYEEALTFNKVKDRIIKSHEVPIDEMEIAQTDSVLDFLHDSLSASSYQDLVMSIFQSTDDLELGIGIQIRHKNNILNYALDESQKESNTALINTYKDDGGKIDKDNFIIINESEISLIAIDLPANDTSKGKQIRDFLEIVTLSANTRIDALGQRGDLDELKSNIYQIFKKTNDSFSTIQDNMDDQVITISELFLSFEENLMATCARANISDSHRDLIKLIVHDAKSELNLILTSSLTVDDHFMNVMLKLEKAYCPDRDDTEQETK